MYYYIFFFLTLAFINLTNLNISYSLKKTSLILLFIYLLIFVGFRHQVGGDWITYQTDFYKYIKDFDIYNFSYKRDFAYEFISFIAYNLNLTIHYVNLICAFIFLYAIFTLGKEFNNYLLVIIIAFPYIFIVGAMGYTKQSTAFALIILAYLSLKKDFYIKFLLYSILAIFFHKSAIAVVSILIISKFKLNFKNLIIFLILLVISYSILINDKSRIVSYLQHNNYKSDGVFIRIFINFIPAMLFFYYYKYLNFNIFEKRFIFINICLTFLCLLFAFEFSTFVDRFLVYFAILQILIYPKLLEYKNNSIKIRLMLISFYFSYLLGWFIFANHSIKWLPYNNLIL
jgi:hypothetical protein